MAFRINSPDTSEAAFVKYGPLLAMGEARTQDYIASFVNEDKDVVVLVPQVYCAFRHDHIGYLVMQYIDGDDSNQDDLEAIAAAVRRIMLIDSPTTSPGPVGRGPVVHRVFPDDRSSILYNSVEELQLHMNSVSSAPTLHINYLSGVDV